MRRSPCLLRFFCLALVGVLVLSVTTSPSVRPTAVPSVKPSFIPTVIPTTVMPSLTPTSSPSSMRSSYNAIVTIAGTGSSSSGGTSGAATAVKFDSPQGVWLSSMGIVYVVDYDGYCVRKFSYPGGIVVAVAGIPGSNGATGDNGPATSALLNLLYGVVVDTLGVVYIADFANCKLRMVSVSGIISTIAGTGTNSNTGDNGPASSAALRPIGLWMDSQHQLYVTTDIFVRRIGSDVNRIITTIAGASTSASFSGDGGPATSATITTSYFVFVDSVGVVYIGDTSNNRVRRVTTGGIISTVIGTGSTLYNGDQPGTSCNLNNPIGVVVDPSNGDIYVASTRNYLVQVLTATSGIVTIFAGNQNSAYSGENVAATSAGVRPWYLFLDTNSRLFISDVNNRVRMTYPVSPTLMPTSPTMIPTSASPTTMNPTLVPSAIPSALPSVVPSIVPSVKPSISPSVVPSVMPSLTPTTLSPSSIRNSENSIITIAGTGTASSTGTGGVATAMTLNIPRGLWLTSMGTVYVVENNGFCVRKFSYPNGIVVAVAGTGSAGSTGDNGPATSALLYYPYGIVVDTLGVVYIADKDNYKVRMVSVSGIITTIAGKGTASSTGDSGPATSATLNGPAGLWMDSVYRLYVACYNSNTVRRIGSDVNRIITTIAGTGSASYSGDGGPASSARLNTPYGVFVDSVGVVYIGDTSNNRVRRVTTGGIISTVIGTGSTLYNGDQPGTSCNLNTPFGVVVDSSNGDIYVASLSNYLVQVLTGTSGIATVFAGNQNSAYSGENVAATSAGMCPNYLYLDTNNRLYISDNGNNILRMTYPSSLTTLPTMDPSTSPSQVPTRIPSVSPSFAPSVVPSTLTPSVLPSVVPSLVPSVQPSLVPSVIPSAGPSLCPSFNPSVRPSVVPTMTPSDMPSLSPSVSPSTAVPSVSPSLGPTVSPSVIPSLSPTVFPTVLPTAIANPNTVPSIVPTSMKPSVCPSILPSLVPSVVPSVSPSVIPSVVPSVIPSVLPSVCPSVMPSVSPSLSTTTAAPSFSPIVTPAAVTTMRPSVLPSVMPSVAPSSISPSFQPTLFPSVSPSVLPSVVPTSLLPTIISSSVHPTATTTTVQPSVIPSITPSVSPSMLPTVFPSSIIPSVVASVCPSVALSVVPSVSPTTTQTGVSPSVVPSTTSPSILPSACPNVVSPTAVPSVVPSISPSVKPNLSPTFVPSVVPSVSPSTTLVLSVVPSVAADTVIPTSLPSLLPSILPSTMLPSVSPTLSPSVIPSVGPSSVVPTNLAAPMHPSVIPSTIPSLFPTVIVSSECPSVSPSLYPSVAPSSVNPLVIPSISPSEIPSGIPTHLPSAIPAVGPASLLPSLQPTETPSLSPNVLPTVGPTTLAPTVIPSFCPTELSSVNPSASPSTTLPSVIPSNLPTAAVTSAVPSFEPTLDPSVMPSVFPTTIQPSRIPTVLSTSLHSILPSIVPSVEPSVNPSINPSIIPSTIIPSVFPSVCHSLTPSGSPSVVPTVTPSVMPSVSPSVSLSSLHPSVVPSLAPSTVIPSPHPTTQSPSAAPSTVDFYLSHPKASLPSNDSISVLGMSDQPFKIVIPFFDINSGRNGVAFDNIVLSEGTTASVSLIPGSVSPVSLNVNDGSINTYGNTVGFDSAMRSVSMLKDVNGDGHIDLIIGDPYAARCYVLYGTTLGLRSMTTGFTIFGEAEGDLTGWSVSDAGDVNNDTLHDIIIGAPFNRRTGAFYVIYGKTFTFDVDLNNLTESQGFAVYGAMNGDYLGISVSSAGDVNKDGADDVIVGAVLSLNYYSGAAYVVFGGRSLVSMTTSQMTLQQGYKLYAIGYWYAGYSVSAAGDVNKDGFDDVIIGSSPQKSSFAPTAFLVYGASSVTGDVLLTSLTASQGIKITGGGVFVSDAGDIDADGYTDVLVWSNYATSSKVGIVLFNSVNQLSAPTRNPTVKSRQPTTKPTVKPTRLPTLRPSAEPTETPPSAEPIVGSSSPSSFPSSRPSIVTNEPSLAPSEPPTVQPSTEPSEHPSMHPTLESSETPSRLLTRPPNQQQKPSLTPFERTTRLPAGVPSASPSLLPALLRFNILEGGKFINTTQGAVVPVFYYCNASGLVSIQASSSVGVTYIVTPRSDMEVVLWTFNVSIDMIDLTAFTSIKAFSDFKITAGSAIVNLPDGQLIRISNHQPSDILESNFVLGDLSDSHNKAADLILKMMVICIPAGLVTLVGFFLTYVYFWAQKKLAMNVAVRRHIMNYSMNLKGDYITTDDYDDVENNVNTLSRQVSQALSDFSISSESKIDDIVVVGTLIPGNDVINEDENADNESIPSPELSEYSESHAGSFDSVSHSNESNVELQDERHWP